MSELEQKLAEQLRSALLYILGEKADEFVDEYGDELPFERGGNLSCTSFDCRYGEYDFDFGEALDALRAAGRRLKE